MFEVGFSEAEGFLLRNAMEIVMMIEPQGTLCYSTDGLSLISSQRHGFVTLALQITHSAVTYFYSDEDAGSSGVDFATMYCELVLGAGGAENSVYMTGDEEQAELCFIFENTSTNEITDAQMQLREVMAEHENIDGRLQYEYEAVIGIPSAQFTNMITQLNHNGDQEAFLRITDKEVLFSGLNDAFVLAREFGECIIGGVGEEEEIEISFRLDDIIAYEDASAHSNLVWILHSHSNDVPAMLNYSIGVIGNLKFYIYR